MDTKHNIYSTIELDRITATILNAINAQIAIISPDGELVAYNREWKEFRDELQERETWSHPQLDANILKCLQAPLAEGNDFALRLLLGIKDVLNHERDSFETIIPINFSIDKKWFRITVNKLGNKEGAVLIYEDVSSQTRSREYLRETKQKLDKHFENSLYGILIADNNLKILEANNAACDLLKTTKRSLEESNILDFLDLELDADSIQKRINRKGNFFGERELTTSNGNKLPVELNVTVYRNDNGTSITSWAFKDISDKKSTEQALKVSMQQYKLQFNNTLEGTIIGRPDGTILEANPAVCQILGYTYDELINLHRVDILDPNNPVNATAVKNRKVNGEVRGEVELTHKEGHKIPAELSSVIFEVEDGTQKTIVSLKDISIRKGIESQLEAEKEFTEKAISSLATAFFVIDLQGNLIRWNKILEEELGYSKSELFGKNVLNLIHPDDVGKVREILENELTGNKVNIEVRCLSKNQEIVHYLFTGTSFQQDGTDYIVGSGLNRNDLVEIESEKKRKEVQLSQLFTNSPIGIVKIDPDGSVTDINRSFENIFGYNKCELLDKNIDDVLVPEGDLSTHKARGQNYFTGESFQSEAVRTTKSGKEIPVLIGAVPVEVDGEVTSLFGLYVDITERKILETQILQLLRAEKEARLHLQELFEESPSGIALLEGENHTFTFANITYKQLVEKSDLEGKPVSEVLPELEEQGFTSLLDDCYKHGKTIRLNEKEVYFKRPDSDKSTTHYLNLVYKPQKDHEGSIYGIFVEAIDVTEQVEARKLVEKSLQEKEILLNEVHHRVKNNLAIVSGLIELEMMGSLDENINKHLYSTLSRISTIGKTHELLYQNESLTHISFDKYINSMLGGSGNPTDENFRNLIKDFDLSEVILNVNQAIPAGMLLNEVIETFNDIKQKGTDTDGSQLLLKLYNIEDKICISIIDKSQNLISEFEQIQNDKSNLRLELIDVLLTQINGSLILNKDDEHSMDICFMLSEAKGPHSAL